MNIDEEYKKLINYILINGDPRKDRTGVGTLSCFDYNYKIDLREGFPLLTTKKLLFKNIVHELMWLLRGEQNIKTLKAPKIWEPWADQDGYIGPSYSQLVKWRSVDDYNNPYVDYDGGEGVHLVENQVESVIESIKTNPTSRRHIISLWNVGELKHMTLPPCLFLYQFYVSQNKYLDMKATQRSVDCAIGLPHNIGFCGLFQTLIARECNLTPRFFSHSLGDVHIYTSHTDNLIKQMERDPRPLPSLKINSDSNIWELSERDLLDDFELTNYNPHPFIKYEVAV